MMGNELSVQQMCENLMAKMSVGGMAAMAELLAEYIGREAGPSQEELDSVRLEMTCTSCPEQYDAFIGDRQIGYLRLRHGQFSVRHAPTDRLVHSACPEGDGCFFDDERDRHLHDAKRALLIAERGV